MDPRFNLAKQWPAGYDAMEAFHRTVADQGLERPLIELVKIRASQINGCAFCIDMHTKDALALGESDERLHLVAAWQEAPVFTERERAALAFTEAVTLVADTHVPDDVYELAGSQFPGDELVKLLFAIVAINAWNRLAITARSTAGRYRSTLTPADA